LVIEAVNKLARSRLVLLALKIVCLGTFHSLLLYLDAAPILFHVDVAHGLLHFHLHPDAIHRLLYLAHVQEQPFRAYRLVECVNHDTFGSRRMNRDLHRVLQVHSICDSEIQEV